MKKVIIALALLVAGFYTNAQQKIGYINSQEIVSMMPEAKKASADVQAYKKSFETEMVTMQKELETKFKAYQDGAKTMSEPIKAVKEKELQDLQGRMGSFEQTANEKIEDKLQELLAPINDKAQKAIEAVAKEKGYTYILDTSVGAILYALPSDNILEAVKAKLGIKDTPAATTPGTIKK
ncbi:MAG TPA: OmpH family outer membrane protein [Chitinophagaceae bacterium]|nr:OmpH family outer membrane protein [Chitinophagaceae bacterium]